MKAQEYIKPIIAAAFTAATAQATLFNMVSSQWEKAKAAGIKPSDYRDALVSGLTGEDGPYVTTHYANRSASERPAYSKNTILKYLVSIDESAFRQRQRTNTAAKAAKQAETKSKSEGYTVGKILDAARTAGLTKQQVKALFDALNA